MITCSTTHFEQLDTYSSICKAQFEKTEENIWYSASRLSRASWLAKKRYFPPAKESKMGGFSYWQLKQGFVIEKTSYSERYQSGNMGISWCIHGAVIAYAYDWAYEAIINHQLLFR